MDADAGIRPGDREIAGADERSPAVGAPGGGDDHCEDQRTGRSRRLEGRHASAPAGGISQRQRTAAVESVTYPVGRRWAVLVFRVSRNTDSVSSKCTTTHAGKQLPRHEPCGKLSTACL